MTGMAETGPGETVPDAGPAWRWTMRIVALLCAPLALFAARDGAIGYWATQLPESVPVMLRDNVELRWADVERRSIDPGWVAANRDRANASALSQLRASPLTASALRELGRIASLKVADAGAGLFRDAERVTRRDALNQLELIGVASRAGDFADGLRHYDRILVTAPAAQGALFPTLATALVDPEVRKPLATFAAREWFSQFLAAAIDLGADPAAAVDLYARAAGTMPRAEQQRVGLKLVAQLSGRGRLAGARGIAATIPGFGPAMRDQFALTASSANPALAPLTWKLHNDEVVESTFNPPDQLVIRVSSGRPSLVAERLMLAGPGSYILSHDVSHDAGEATAGLTWTVTCTNGPALPIVRVPPPQGRYRFSARIDIPGGCGAQSWQLTATPEDIQSTSSVTIARLALVPQ